MDTVTLARENTLLKARLAQVEAALAESQDANRRLEDILRTSQREKFGKRSEKLSPDQFNLPLEDAELAQGVLEAAQEKAEFENRILQTIAAYGAEGIEQQAILLYMDAGLPIGTGFVNVSMICCRLSGPLVDSSEMRPPLAWALTLNWAK